MTNLRRKGRWSIDLNLLALFVQMHRTQKRQAGVRTAGEESGTSGSAISRIENKHHVDAPTMLAVCRWIGADPFWFLVDPATGARATMPAAAALPPGVSRETITETARETGAA